MFATEKIMEPPVTNQPVHMPTCAGFVVTPIGQ